MGGAPVSKQIQNPNFQMSKTHNRTRISRCVGFGHCDFEHSDLPFDLAQGGESFDSAQDREPAERLVEPFRASCFEFRIWFEDKDKGLRGQGNP
jgi:hypothetical protein